MILSLKRFKIFSILLLSFTIGSCSTNKSKPPAEAPLICPSNAFIKRENYVLKPLTSTSDKEFHANAAIVYTLYPQLLDAYDLLYGCVIDRFPELKPQMKKAP